MTSRTRNSAPSIFSRARRLALALLLLPLAATAQSAAGCNGRTLCVEAVQVEGYTQLIGVNRNAFPVTVRLALTPINMLVEQGAGAAWVVAPGESAPLMRLRVKDPSQPSDFRYSVGWSRGDYQAEHDDSYVYSLPFRPGPGFLVSQGYNGEFSHNGDSSYGVDFAMPEGTPVVAAREGRVVSVRSDSDIGGPDLMYADSANYVVIQHVDGTFAEYLHLQHQGVRVKQGDSVSRGQLIGLSGNTGFSGGPHLHFMVAGATRDGGRRSFPVRFQTGDGVLAELQSGQQYHNQLPSLPGTEVGTEGLIAAEGEHDEPIAPVPVDGADQSAVGSGG